MNRRNFLKGSSSLIALPVMESMGYRAFASVKPMSPPKRIVFLGFGWGITNETWFPDKSKTGKEYTLSSGLAPLARHKENFTVVQGCSNKFSNEAHWGSTFWLTGANRYSQPGQSFHNSISADQMAAGFLGKDTRYGSLQLGCDKASDSGHGPGSMSWDMRGKPLAGPENPVVAFHRLFSTDNTPLSERQAMLSQKRSILDAVMGEAKDIQKGLNKTDNDKLNEYFESIRDIETRLGKDEQWLSVPKAKSPIPEPKPGLAGKEEIKVMYDLIAAALQTDTTRVITYRQPVGTLLQSIDIKYGSHDISHYSPGPRMEASQKRDAVQSELLAGLLDKLQTTKEPNGTSLLDNSTIVYGSNIRSIHFLDNCPTLIAGGGANIKLGQHLVLPKDTPLCNVWLTLLNGMGMKLERHGDSTGVARDLMA